MSVNIDSKGAYILLLRMDRLKKLKIGRVLCLDFHPGIYCYVGSALGPGGLKTRIKRHASTPLKYHWHIDYLMPHARLKGALVLESIERVECAIASWVKDLAGESVNDFGSTDCNCDAHLFHLGHSTTEGSFIQQAMAAFHLKHLSIQALKRLAGINSINPHQRKT